MDPQQEEVVTGEEVPQQDTTNTVDVRIIVAKGKEIFLPQVHAGETIHAIKQVLADFQETAFFTAYHLAVKHIVDTDNQKHEYSANDYGDYSPIGTFLTPTSKEVVFTIQFDLYDVKKIKLHIDRLREVCNRSHIPSGISKKSEDDEPESNGDSSSKKADAKFVPKLDDVVESVKLNQYFREVLCLDGNKTAFNPDFNKLPLNNVIKSVYVSGWNPVPAHRRLQGDLMYLEVLFAAEGTIHITCTNRGFFVNKSNRNTFDPTPAAQPFFAHDLFGTIGGYSQQARAAWVALCEASASWFSGSEPGALDGLIRNFVGVNFNETTLPTGSWIAPSVGSGLENVSQAKPSYDVYRVQQSLADLCGAEELGAPREWNDEIQSIRSLQAQDDGEKIMKARLEYKIITEFSESCKKMVMAVANGEISPLTYGVPNESEVYSYNGIFVSRAEDIKDAFHIYDGDEAARKANSRDLANQKLIRTLDIEGLGSVLCTLVDYKGTRYIAQSIIPGILAQGEAGARLMYGIMEENKPLTVKESSLAVMKQLAEKLFLGTRHLPQYPFGEAVEATAESKEAADAALADLDPLNKLIKSSEALTTPIRIDDEDNVAVDPETKSVPHVGPIDAKIIRGTDGRNYLLEIMRLTPRDANYVAERGTGKIAAVELAKVDGTLSNTYILRQELVGIYLQRKVNLERSKLLTEAQGRQQEEREKLAAKAKEEAAQAVTVDDGEESDVKIVKETDAEKDRLAALDAELENTLTEEYAEKYRAINVQSVGLEINPNVFLPFTSEVRPEQLAKDEEAARDIANLLWDFVLPAFIRQVREGDVTPRDATGLVQALHRTGINVRYLGRLAYLAVEQEREDTELFLQGKQRIHGMPQYFTEMLLVEMIARGVKHVVNRHFRENKLFAAAPAQSLASLLNHVLSALVDAEAAEAANNNNAEGKTNGKKNKKSKQPKEQQPAAAKAAPAAAPAATAAPAPATSSKGGKKGGKKGRDAVVVDQSLFSASEVVESAVDIFSSKDDLFKELHQIIASRFLFNMSIYDEEAEDEPLVVNEENAMETLANLSKKLLAKSSLRRRVNPVVLLRRICQQLGLVIVAKDYTFASTTSPIITPQDIITLVPKVKSCEPDTYLPDFQDYLASSAAFLQQGNGLAAFEAAQEALNMVTQVTGTAHEQAFQAMDQLTAVFVATADVKAATHMSARTLALSAQVQGLDGQETIQHHIQLAMLESEMDNLSAAFRHLLTAKYIVQLVAGDRHPELGNIFFRLSTLYEKVGDFDAAMLCIHSARRLTTDLGRNAMLAQAEAALAFRHHRYAEALALQKHGFRLVRDIFGVEDERVQMAKKNLETYIRASSEAAAHPQVAAAAASAVTVDDGDDSDNDNQAGGKNVKKNKNKKNKNKGGKK